MNPAQTITLALTGASGMPYAMRLLESLLAADRSVYLLYSQAAQIVAQQEMGLTFPSSSREVQLQLRDQDRQSGKEAWFEALHVFLEGGREQSYAEIAARLGATESAVKREIRTDSPRVIHLATHGLVDASGPACSSVALAAGEGEDR